MSLIKRLKMMTEPLVFLIKTNSDRIDEAESKIEPLKFLIDKKVDAESGKSLSTNDYTDRDKIKLDSLPTDVLTKSKQNLSDSQQEQIRANIGAIGGFNDIFYEINPFRIFLSGSAKSSKYSFSSDKVNDLAYRCLLSETVGTRVWQKNYFHAFDDPHDESYNPNVNKDAFVRKKFSITVGSIIQIYFQNSSSNAHQFQLAEASSTVRYIGNGFLYNTNLPNTRDEFCVTFDIDGTVYIYSKTKLWPGIDTSNPLIDPYRIREWGLYYNDIAYAALDPKYIPNALPDVSREDSGKIPMVQSDGTWGLVSISNAEEASF